MNHYIQTLFKIDHSKLAFSKGFRQSLLTLFSLLLFYMLGELRIGLLVSMGTLSHIYVFGGTLNSKVRTVVIVTVNLALAMMLGTLTGHNDILFGVFLIIYTVIPYYVCNVIELKGPSSTFFLVTYGIASVMPYEPELAIVRGLWVLLGGVLCLILVYLEARFFLHSPEKQVIKQDFKMLDELFNVFNDKQLFHEKNREAVEILTKGSGLLHSAKPVFKKRDISYERSLLIHHLAQGIYAELLELNTKGVPALSEELKAMMHYIRQVIEGESYERWKRHIEISPTYHQLLDYIFEVEEILFAPYAQVNYKVSMRKTYYFKRLLNNLNPESMVFIMTLKYAVIMTIVVCIAILFNIERPYWVALSAHTVLLGNTSVNSIQRAIARVFGTTGGMVLILWLMNYQPSFLIIILLIALTCGIAEVMVAANYSLAMIVITMQVLLMSGIASGHLSRSFAYLRIIDVVVGVSIALIGVVIFSRFKAQERLPQMIAAAIRIEGQIFHQLFSKQNYAHINIDQKILEMHLAVENVKWAYQNAAGELNADRQTLAKYYPVIFQLEQLSYMLSRQTMNKKEMITQEEMGIYLTAFEDTAKYFEFKIRNSAVELPVLQDYHRLKNAIRNLQYIQL